MSNQAQVRGSLYITAGQLVYRSNPTSFNANVVSGGGSTPGLVIVSLVGTNVDLSKLTALGGFVWFQNLDLVNSVHCGPYDAGLNRFFPLFMLLPGEFYIARLSTLLGDVEHSGTSGSPAGVTWQFRAENAPVEVQVDAFNP